MYTDPESLAKFHSLSRSDHTISSRTGLTRGMQKLECAIHGLWNAVERHEPPLRALLERNGEEALLLEDVVEGPPGEDVDDAVDVEDVLNDERGSVGRRVEGRIGVPASVRV